MILSGAKLSWEKLDVAGELLRLKFTYPEFQDVHAIVDIVGVGLTEGNRLGVGPNRECDVGEVYYTASVHNPHGFSEMSHSEFVKDVVEMSITEMFKASIGFSPTSFAAY